MCFNINASNHRKKNKECKMNFIVTGYDFEDAEALNRRMHAREAHMANIHKMFKEGQILYAAAMLDDAGEMCGSTLFLEMPDRGHVEAYLEKEAYITGKVWEDVVITPCKIPPLFKQIFS